MSHQHMEHMSYFNFNELHNFIFKGWMVHNPGQTVFTCTVFFFMAVIVEGLKYCESVCGLKVVKVRSKLACCSESDITAETPLTPRNRCFTQFVDISRISFKRFLLCYRQWILIYLARSGCFILRVILGYIIMLAVMSFNVFIFLSIVLGTFLGFFFFNLCPTPISEVASELSDCCC